MSKNKIYVFQQNTVLEYNKRHRKFHVCVNSQNKAVEVVSIIYESILFYDAF